MNRIKEYIVGLTENYSNQAYHELKDFGVEVTWVSAVLPQVIAVKTDKSIDELENFFLIDHAHENYEGSFYNDGRIK